MYSLKNRNNVENKMESSSKKTLKAKSGSVLDNQESNITQILSQRLCNMEQQLVLLRDYLKDAVETLKRKDQEITTLENKVALAERRRDAEKNCGSPGKTLCELSEDVDSGLKSKQELLQNECHTLSKKLQEMEKFFGDYGLAWVKEDALDERDQDNLWVRKTNIHYTPDFDNIFLVVEELNVGNAEPQIVKTGNTAQFKTAALLHLTLYADGIQLENNPFRQYDSPSVEEFFHDLEDGYFPSELRGEHPEGVIFKVKDMRSTKFADDPNKRPTKRKNRSLTSSPNRTSTSTLQKPSKSSTGKEERSAREKNPNANASPVISRRSKTLSRKGSRSSKGKDMKNVEGGLTEGQKIADGKEKPHDSVNLTDEVASVEADGGIKPSASPDEGTPGVTNNEKGLNHAVIGPGIDDKTPKTPPVSGGPGGVVIEGVADATMPSAGRDPHYDISTEKNQSDPKANDTGMNQIFSSDKSPQHSSTRVPENLSTNGQTTELDKEQTKDSFGLPNPPRSPNTSSQVPKPTEPLRNDPKTELEKEQTDDSFGLPIPPLSPDGSSQVPKPNVGPPTKHFENFFLKKVGETQTSGTHVISQPPQLQPHSQPQPANVTNITYNEGPITIQMTPSELRVGERKTAPTDWNMCSGRNEVRKSVLLSNQHPKLCNCANRPPPTASKKEDGGIGSFGTSESSYISLRVSGFRATAIGLTRTPGETEYRENYSGNADNLLNALRDRFKFQDKKEDMSKPPDPPKMGEPFDPTIQWPNFVFLGHPKGQETFLPLSTPVLPPASTKNHSDVPHVIQLNEKTSERMISVKMRTRSGHKEFNANLYPEEPVKKLWSLLKLNDKEYNLTFIDSPHKQLRRGSIGENFKDKDLLLVISKPNDPPGVEKTGNKSLTDRQPSKRTESKSSTNDQFTKIKREVETPSSEGTNKQSRSSKSESRRSSKERSASNIPGLSTAKTVTEATTTSRDGSNVTNVSINMNVDSHKSSGERGKVGKVDQPKQDPLENQKVYEKAEDTPSGSGISQLAYTPKKPKDHLSVPNLLITPKNRAKALSEHLSKSSLHSRKSFQSISYRNSPIRGSVHMEPVLMDKDVKDTSADGKSEKHPSTTASKESIRTPPHSSPDSIPNKIIHPKNLSNNQRGDISSFKEGINSATTPNTIPSSQSIKHFDGKVPSDTSLKERISVSKLSLEKKVRRGSSKSFMVDSSNTSNSPAYKSFRSQSKPPLTAAEINNEIHSLFPREKRLDRDRSVPSSMKHFDRKAPSNTSLKERISLSKLSLEKKIRRGSSKSFKVESRNNTNSLKNNSIKSLSKPPLAAAEIRYEIHSPYLHDKRLDRDRTERSGSEGRNSPEYSSPVAQQGEGVGSRSPRNTEQDNGEISHALEVSASQNGRRKGDPFDTKTSHSPAMEPELPPDDNVENISINKGNSQEKPVDSRQTSEKRSSPGEHSKKSVPEVVTPMVTDLVQNYNQVTPSKANAAGDHSDDTSDMKDPGEPTIPKKSDNVGNYDDDSESTDPTVGGGTKVSAQVQDENVLKSEIKVPNTDRPHIVQSDADFGDEKEAVVSSVNYELKYAYDKHDSEQEFKRSSLKNTTSVPTKVENEQDQKQSLEPINKNEKKDADSSYKKKGGGKIKKRKSPEKDEKEHRKNSQELATFNGSGDENPSLTSPVISKEDIVGDSTRVQDEEDDISERILT